jgi:hypothetical protein
MYTYHVIEKEVENAVVMSVGDAIAQSLPITKVRQELM